MPDDGDEDPRHSPPQRKHFHNVALAGLIYSVLAGSSAACVVGKEDVLHFEMKATAIKHARDMLEQMGARDPLEAMLLNQALWTHARVAHLNVLVSQAGSVDHKRILSEAADRASNTFRRQMAALKDYRQEPALLKQTNIAGQQIVQNNLGTCPGDQKKNVSNEQGCHDVPTEAKSLPTDRGRQAVPSAGGAAEPSLDRIDRAKNPRRQD